MPTMKYLFAAALLATIAPAMAVAETAAPAAAKFTVDTPIEALANDPAAKAALDANFPGVTTHAMYEQFKGMSLKQLQPMAADKITDAGIAKLAADLAVIK
jgi:phosphate-selective porin